MALTQQQITPMMNVAPAPAPIGISPNQLISPNGVASAQSIGNNPGMQQLMLALLQARRKKVMGLPQGTPQGTAASDLATGPQAVAPDGSGGALSSIMDA